MEVLEVEFKDVSKNYSLRSDTTYYSFVQKTLPSTLSKVKYPILRFADFIKAINNGKDIKKEGYSLSETRYIYLTVNNIKKYEIVFNEVIHLDEEIGEKLEKYRLEKGDLIITRSGTVGICKLFDIDDNRIYIPSGYLIIVKLKDGVNKKFLEYYLSHEFIETFIWVHAAGKAQQNISQAYIKRIPVPDLPSTIQEKLVSEIEKIEEKIKTEKQKIIPLQDVIDDVLIKYGVKSKKFKREEFKVFATKALSIGKQKFLRCGAQYRAFWDVHRGLLFNGKTKYPIVKLGSLMRLHKAKTLKKGILDKEYILIELEDIEQRTGRILNMERIVTEIGSDKTYFGDADLITTRLRPYLGYTILNIPELELIGTTELLPFKVNKDKAYPEYLKYVLLSHEYLKRSQFLMYGKEHPRIHPLDLLSIKIPLPPKDIQKKIISEIQKQEKINDEAKQKLSNYRNQINDLIFEYLTSMEETKND